jgi:hypothetical protein
MSRIRFDDGAFACKLRELLQIKSRSAILVGIFTCAAFDARAVLEDLEASTRWHEKCAPGGDAFGGTHINGQADSEIENVRGSQ